MSARSESWVTSRRSCPSRVIRPPVTSWKRGRRSSRVDFPAPLSPTKATTSPRVMVRLMSRRTGPSAPGYSKLTPSKATVSRKPSTRAGARTVGHRRGRVEDLEDALHRPGGLLHRVHQARQLARGAVQHDHGRDEREEDARRARAADHLVAAVEEDAHDGQGAGDLQEGLAQLVGPDVLERQLQQALVEAVEAPLGVALAAEDLDDLGSREGLLEEDGQLGHLLLLALVDAVEAPADHLHHQRDEGKGDQGGQGEEGLAHQHHRHQGHDGSRVAHDLDEHRRRHAGQPRHVVQHPRHQLRRVRAAEEGQGHAPGCAGRDRGATWRPPAGPRTP